MRTQLFIILSIVGLLAMSASAGTYSGGTGEPNDPYLIATAEDMNQIGANPDDWDAHFLLLADINLADYTGTQFNIIGNESVPFTGVFDGNDHTISNFTYECNDTDNIGLFSYIYGSNAKVKDLTLIDPDVNAAGDSWRVGSLAGWLESGAVISCNVEGGYISGCWAVGGLVGINCNGTISNCYVIGAVAGDDEVGGLVGANVMGTICNCYTSGLVDGGMNGYEIGGLVGGNWEHSTISESYSTSSVTGRELVGGLVGYNKDTISNCYANGSVAGNNSSVGGLAGASWKASTISNCYATSTVDSGNFVGGGLVGFAFWNADDAITGSFWDIETSGQSSSAGGMPKSTAEMKRQSTFMDACWDFIEVWDIGENQTYPFLRVYSAGDINHDDIVNFYDLAILADHWLQGL